MTSPNLNIVSNIKEPQAAARRRDLRNDERYSQAAVGHRLRAARVARGITEHAAAAACKVSLTTYRKWEAGRPQRNWHKQLSRLAKKFDASLPWIAHKAGDPPLNPADGKIAFLSAKPSHGKTSSPAAPAHRALTRKELLQQYKAMLMEQKVYISDAIAAFKSLRNEPPPAA
jgi:transcriptional regulator with XRE-family HTH domain